MAMNAERLSLSIRGMQDCKIRRPSWPLAVSLCLASFVAGSFVGQPIANPIAHAVRAASERFTATLHAGNTVKGSANEPEIRIVVLAPASRLTLGAPPAFIRHASPNLTEKTNVRRHKVKRTKPASPATRADPGNREIQTGEAVE